MIPSNLNPISSSRTLTALALPSNPIPFPRQFNPPNLLHPLPLTHLGRQCVKPPRFTAIRASNPTKRSQSVSGAQSHNELDESVGGEDGLERDFKVQVGNAVVPSFIPPWSKLSLNDQASFLLSFAACTTSVAFTSLVVASIPTLHVSFLSILRQTYMEIDTVHLIFRLVVFLKNGFRFPL
ncbi:hypothetical protein LINGRAPRIM_LOCUS3415 [Linum grandiflorum]